MATKHEIDFEIELQKGRRSYDKKVGQWWLSQSSDAAHAYAYRNIARQLRKQFDGKDPKVIIDYACGSGRLLTHLVRQFSKSHIIAIDGSRLMLEHAAERVDEIRGDALDRIELIESDLPNFSLEKFKADLTVFCFPNICPSPDDQPYYDEHGAKCKPDVKVARWLSKTREKDPDDETCFDKPEDVFNQLIDAKVISRNLRHLTRKGGICARIEYANAPREDLTKLVRWRLLFEQGALNREIDGYSPERIFKFKESMYFQSKVIEDVYAQNDPNENEPGGYHINILKAV